ncbi:MAG: hypothetical protein LBR88_05385 [Zoogloeaceae bacterium]|nr:hypothetical protein [Zoogloeaceae bacterium]
MSLLQNYVEGVFLLLIHHQVVDFHEFIGVGLWFCKKLGGHGAARCAG